MTTPAKHWTYNQKSGFLTDPDGAPYPGNYSGRGNGLNNPTKEAVHRVGPIPAGWWKIRLTPLKKTVCGPLALPLTPVGHDAHGRTKFRIHGDNALRDHTASEGCIIAPPATRQAIITAGVTDLLVVSH